MVSTTQKQTHDPTHTATQTVYTHPGGRFDVDGDFHVSNVLDRFKVRRTGNALASRKREERRGRLLELLPFLPFATPSTGSI